jgi:CMP-N-acetylneuraminic acid synthetase
MPEQFTALLPMKGHSERVPGKNVRPLAGRPLCLWMLETLAQCALVAEILVDTDSETIRALLHGRPKTRVLDRPEELRGDFVPMNAIIAHDLAFVGTAHVLQTHATNPFLGPASLTAALAAYLEARPERDCLFTVTARHNRFYWPDCAPVNHNPAELLRTQDLAPLYEENSCLYVFSPASFHANNNRRIGQRPLLFPLDKLEALDIDDEEDFALAQALALSRATPGFKEVQP